MTAALRTVVACTTLLLVNMASATGQISARATCLGDGSFDLPPAGPSPLRDPAAIAVLPNGDLHIVDHRGQVMVFDRASAPVRTYGSGSLDEPVAVTFDELGRAYVLDKGLKQVNVFDGRGEPQHVIAGSERGASQLNDPVALIHRYRQG